MKSLNFSFKFIFFSLVFIAMSAFTEATEAAGVEGEWVLEVANAPYGYEKGEVTISKEGEEYKAAIKINYGMISGKKVKVDGNNVTFDIDVEGMTVGISMDIDGDTFTGEAKSMEGNFKLMGKRK